MVLDEAIKYCEEVAEKNEKQASWFWGKEGNPNYEKCVECAEKHRQLAEWLKDYKTLKEQEPCEDCISREDALMCMTGEYVADMTCKPEDIISKHIQRLRALPPVTPQLKMGRWIDDKCSVCGKGTEDLISSSEWYRNEEPNFCPFCGLKIVILRESEG